MSKPHCGECNFFPHESIDGYGWCDVTGREQQRSDQCTLSRENITDKQALRVLHYAQKWRRGAKTECVNLYCPVYCPPYYIGMWHWVLSAPAVFLIMMQNSFRLP